MKPIGPYVAVQSLPPPAIGVAAADSPIQTLRATDRLTGIPVLLHVLPHARGLPELPSSPHLLPVVDSGMDGEVAYLVTELPLQAHPAQNPLLAARGALAALGALHTHGLAHGGVSGAQLWNHDGGVALAGAGLPWRADASPGGDLQDLVLTLQGLGALPEALVPLRDQPGSLSAQEALALLGGAAAAQAQEPAPPDQPVTLERSASVRTPDPRPSPVRASGAGAGNVAVQTGPTSPSSAKSLPALGKKGAADREGDVVIVKADPSASGESVPVKAQGATSPFSSAPVGQSETPQERRRRQNDERREQAMADSRAAAARKAARLKEQKEEEARESARAAELVALGVPVPEPFQMGFAAETALGVAGADGAAPGLQKRQVERLPASLRRLDGGQPEGTVQRLPASASAARTASARNLAPVRIGWDEDDSWRVVRTVPKGNQTSPLLRWGPLALVALVLLGAALLWAGRSGRPAPAASSAATGAPCCAVAFTLRGAAGVTAQLNVVSAPAAAKLAADQILGVAPGSVNFPVQGTYRLNVVAEGYRSAPLTVTVPRTQPVTIDLGN